ncbi:unnamed protein product [Parascedosporium putredinis]|uniref:Xylanolytic transcriptional activator regulatory domain-containing protein n=1 Tax=Parascedosporium putredinis TaxID=1442378 RepID=A0A9P1M802_9PEZI|nr:unnamed protein product [Parascedosporium putredinis]CAI7992670.1 unnamed protein product [Parascedosporium putredinis]
MANIVHHFLPDIALETSSLRHAVAKLSERNDQERKQPREVQAEDGTAERPWRPDLSPDDSSCHGSQPLSHPSVKPVFDGMGAFADATATERVATGSSWAVFYQQIRETLAHSRRELLQTQPTFLCDTFDADRESFAIPLDLPPRDLVDQYSLKFFAEVNAGNGILDYAQFHNDVEEVYQNSPVVTHASMRTIFLVLALSAQGRTRLSILKRLLRMPKALFHLGRNSRNRAWIDIGCAVRIGQSLGLHIQSPDANVSTQTGNHNKVWWALHNVETFLSCMLGRPPGIPLDHISTSNPPGALHMQDPWTPQDYAVASVSLTQIISSLLSRMYWKQSPENPKVVVKDLLNQLQKWWDDLPVYLRPGRPTAPSYVRSLTHLGLRYHHAILLLTRPYLLLSVDHSASGDDHWKDCVEKCENSNRQSIALLMEMAKLGLLSELSFFDAYYIISNSAILFLRYLKTPTTQLMAEMKRFQPLFPFATRLGVGRWSQRAFEALLEATKVSDDQHR